MISPLPERIMTSQVWWSLMLTKCSKDALKILNSHLPIKNGTMPTSDGLQTVSATVCLRIQFWIKIDLLEHIWLAHSAESRYERQLLLNVHRKPFRYIKVHKLFKNTNNLLHVNILSMNLLIFQSASFDAYHLLYLLHFNFSINSLK